MGRVVKRHDEIIAKAVEDHGGVLVKSKGEGDSTFSVFSKPTDAVSAAVDAQRALQSEDWPDAIDLLVRGALHSGEAELRDGDYYGTTINRCARLRGVAHGGQVVCSETTAGLIADALPENVGIKSLGTHRLRDLERPEQIFQISRAPFPEEFPPLRSLDAFRHNLPTQRTNFVGREDEIRIVRKHIDQNRMVTLTGVGGCGKTRLALQVAAEELDAFENGSFFVELGPVSDPEGIPGAVAKAMGLSFGAGVAMASGRPIRDEVLDSLGPLELLLIFDNCEHLVEASAGLIDDILDGCPRVKVLATSREALEVSGEQTHTVPSLELPGDSEVESSEAVRLFCDRALFVREGFALIGEQTKHVAEICRRLDGIPLAIELAAAQVAHLSPHQIAQRLDDRFGLLTGGRRRIQRQQTLAATLDWSHDLLTEDERVLLRRLSVFPGTFTLEAAEEVTGNGLGRRVVEVLRSLVAKSMVVTDEGEDLRYRLLETVRLYAEEKLLAAGESETMRTAHRDWCLALLEADPDVVFPDRVTVEEHNLRAALAWSERERRFDLVGRLASLMLGVWVGLGEIAEGLRCLELGLEAEGDLNPDEWIRVLAARCYIAVAAVESQNLDFILDKARRAIDAAGDTPGAWPALSYAVYALMKSFEGLISDEDVVEDVERSGLKALDLVRGDQAMSVAATYFGLARINTRNVDGAIDILSQVGADDYAGPPALSALAVLHHIRDEHDLASEYAERTRVIAATQARLSDWYLYSSLPSALMLGVAGRHVDATTCIRDLIQEVPTFRIPGVVVAVVTYLGALAVLREDWERAAVLFGACRTQFELGVVRSPTDLALYGHYVPKVRAALGSEGRRFRDRGAAMPIEEALAYGLEA
jgi:predicted ATPase